MGCGAEFNKRNKSGGERVGGVVYAGSTIMGEKTWVGVCSNTLNAQVPKPDSLLELYY